MVEDEEMVRQVARDVLELGGYTVVTAEDGEEALRVVRSRGDEVDVVVLDLVLPRMGGAATLCALHAEQPELPVVLCSGYSEAEVMLVHGRLDYAGFLAKPYTPAELREQVSRALSAAGDARAAAACQDP